VPNDERRRLRWPGRSGEVSVRRADIDDALLAARLLHDFNTEFATPTPGVEALTRTLARLLAGEETIVLLGAEGPDGLALLRLRPSLWAEGLDAYLEELYVAPPRRGRGIGRALLEAAMEAAREAGARRIELGTSETDTAARGLYESCGFSDREGGPDGPKMLFYERDL
jgi:ribosomal protein S18 acetylase RimI-like enzyme